MPKIVFTGSFQYPVGYASTKRITHIINYLNKVGYEIQVILFNNNRKSGEFNNIDFKCLYPFINKILNIICFPFAVILSAKLLYANPRLNKKYLYVYSGITIENFILVKLAKIFGYKIIVDFVEDYNSHEEKVTFARSLKIRSMKYFEKRIDQYADGIVVISSYLQNKFNKLTYEGTPIHLLPVVSEINPFNKENFNDNLVRILYSGTYGNKDGLLFLIDAVKKLVKEKTNILLILTGELKKEVKLKLLSENVPFKETGFISDEELYREMKNADILVMPRVSTIYSNAGFPFKLGEYLATGNPVVATNVGDIEKYLINNVDAIIVQPNSSDALYSGLCFLIDNPETAQNIAQNGLKACINYFDPTKNGNLLLDFIENIK